MNNHFEDLRINLGNYRNGNFQSINVLNNLKNYLNHWVVCFRNYYMGNHFSVPVENNIDIEIEDLVYNFSNSDLFARRLYSDIVCWVLTLQSLINNRLYNLDYRYIPDPPLLYRRNNNLVIML